MFGGFDAIVLTGGASRRMGGNDKTALRIGGRSLLDRALDACREAHRVVVVGPSRSLDRAPQPPLIWTREAPPGTGPLAAIVAGLAALERAAAAPEEARAAEVVVVLAGDLAYVDGESVGRLVAAALGDGAAIRDRDGRLQPLVAAYRRQALTSALAEIGDPRNRPVMLLLDRLRLTPLDDDRAAVDVDTPEDLAQLTKEYIVMDEWVRAACAALGIETPVDVPQLLDVARDVAHNIERPAAPVTTFLVGLAAAQKGGGPDAVAAAVTEASHKVIELAKTWPGASEQRNT